MKNLDIFFAIKRYTVTVNGISVSPLGFLVVEWIKNWLMYRKLAVNKWYTVVWHFEIKTDKLFLPKRGMP